MKETEKDSISFKRWNPSQFILNISYFKYERINFEGAGNTVVNLGFQF